MDYSKKVQDFLSIKNHNYYRVWEPFMKKYDCKAVCELGVFKGDNFMNMIAHGPKLAVAVDTWRNDGVHSSTDAKYSSQELKQQYMDFKEKVKDFDFVKIYREDTSEAARYFKDKSFDFVYIDADHTVEGCREDIQAWYPKVKPGKFLVGHDYNRKFGVVGAVNTFAKEHGLEVIVLRPSNWMIIKPYFG